MENPVAIVSLIKTWAQVTGGHNVVPKLNQKFLIWIEQWTRQPLTHFEYGILSDEILGQVQVGHPASGIDFMN